MSFAARNARAASFALLACAILGARVPAQDAASAPATLAQGSARWSRASAPEWVDPFDLAPLVADRASRADVLLFDLQTDLRREPVETYLRLASVLVDAIDVQAGSQLEIDFDPDYQELLLHDVAIWRDGLRIDATAGALFDVLQRQTSLERRIYDGTHTLLVLLEDVRQGDVLDYAFTLRGKNPVLGEHFLGSFDTRWSDAIAAWRGRLLVPEDVEVFAHAHGDVPDPVERPAPGGGRERVWGGYDVPALIADPEVPTWYDPFPWVQLSTFATWADVVRWGLEQYPLPVVLEGEFARTVDEIRGAHATPEGRVLAALRFVQDEVRYLGITIGTGSHRPSAPDEVLRRRFGDCKDKSLLLVAMLEALGVQADVALVSSTYRGHVRDWHPSPYAFDHAIARARIDGRDVWLDGTGLHQRGGLDDVQVDTFGTALVLAEDRTDLTEIDLERPDEPTTHVRIAVDLGAVDEPAAMRVTTTYRGRDAQQFRFTDAGRDPDERARAFLDFYGRIYSSIEATGPIRVEEDQDANVIVVDERYSVPDFWYAPDDGDGPFAGDFMPLEIVGYVSTSASRRRTMPLGLAHPVDVRVDVVATLDEGWQVPDEQGSVGSQGMQLDYRWGSLGERLELTWRYRSLEDGIPAEGVRAHLDALEQADDVLAYTIQAPGGTERATVLLGAAVGAAGVVIGLVAALLVFLLNPGRRPPSDLEQRRAVEPSGLGGWMVLVTIGVCLQPVLWLVGLPGEVAVYEANGWTMLVRDADGTVDGARAALVLVASACYAALGVGMLLQVVLLFARKRSFPPTFVAVRALDLGLGALAVAILTGVTDADVSEAGLAALGKTFGAGVGFVIWTLYVLRSRRVRNTFVR